tara:strand:- start:227 stop:424 length:198 start_codon:yes stop_codon:yes gene_type:complete
MTLPALTERQARLILWTADLSDFCHDVSELKVEHITTNDTVKIYDSMNELLEQLPYSEYNETILL